MATDDIGRQSQTGRSTISSSCLPEDLGLPRAENFGYMVDSFSDLAPVMEQHQARLVIEGWPSHFPWSGPGALCCTPEGYRAFFEQCPSPAMGVNYDPPT